MSAFVSLFRHQFLGMGGTSSPESMLEISSGPARRAYEQILAVKGCLSHTLFEYCGQSIIALTPCGVFSGKLSHPAV